tara:strand:+ start:544 stop:1086 length:543 start_codon:yes stop_codon:yes gene_type:complete
MKRSHVTTLKLSALLGLFSMLAFAQTSVAHPLKLSASLVEFDPESKTMWMECKVFRDDFERSLSRAILKGQDPSTIKKEDKSKIVNAFFQKYYTITHNGKKLPLDLKASKYLAGHNVLVLRFKPTKVKLRKGDTIAIRNTLFFQDFGYAQSNRITLRIPNFSINENKVSTFSDFKFSFTL